MTPRRRKTAPTTNFKCVKLYYAFSETRKHDTKMVITVYMKKKKRTKKKKKRTTL